MKIKIEKNIPIPEDSNYYANTLRTLEIGDSFCVSKEDLKKWKDSIAGMRRSKKHTGYAFTVRIQEDGNSRIWRTENK